MDNIIIFDTTLRDGEQSPGASMNMAEKLQIARQLDRMKIDVIEAGFPIASRGDFEAVRSVAAEMKYSAVCGLARARKKDIHRCWDAVKEARKPVIHTFLATSPIHRKAKLKMSKKEVLIETVKAVEFASSLCGNVEFSAEDAVRTEIDFLKEVVTAAAEAGAKVINIPDTVGYSMPSEFKNIIREVIEVLPEDIVVSVHCHNDLGMASANSLVAVQAGAKQVECTVNGIGERAGNASMEEIVMSLVTRKDIFNAGVNIDTTQIYPASALVSRLSGLSIQKNKAIVGENAFRHEAGIHQHGVLQDKLTYEIMTPESIGKKEEALVLGKHSGKHAIIQRLKDMGIDTQKIDMEDLFLNFKGLADKKKEVYDDELLTLADEQLGKLQKFYEIDYIHTVSGTNTVPSATVRLKINKEGKSDVKEVAAIGDGPVDACYRAIARLIGKNYILADYRIKAISRGGDSMGEVTVRLKEDEPSPEIQGRGASTDIIEASARAYVAAVNRLMILKKQREQD
ncbi:MAG: 2-isopropylmalate synthase [Elusimicrobiota bacterium]|nr:2-isopropylmalate synthase [Elusimicrobiota bacterium]